MSRVAAAMAAPSLRPSRSCRELVLLTLALFAAASAPAQPAASPPSAAQAEQRQLYAILLTPGPAWKPGKPFAEQGLRDHFHYWMALFSAGRIATAGPLGADSGLVLLFARDLAQAQEVMRADPALAQGTFQATVRPYAPPMVNAGALAEAKKPTAK